jgi:DNA repair protein RecO (recombination protein O)
MRRGEPIPAVGMYRLQVDAGLERVYLLQPGLFQGTELLAMSEADWTAPGALSAAKRLMRQALAVHLGGRPLVSRELFRKP